ncbi:MAG TPA: AraC family transcriptional regulator, partial [Erwinia persicina]|nr:AraC family transcriptional regulator [Erwinia persicina]
TGDRLKGSGETVIDVMEHVGFQTKSNFNREFRRITGKTPTQWRKEAWEQAENH